MTFMGQTSIRAKLTAITMLTSLVVLVFAGSVIVLTELESYRERSVENLAILGNVMGKNSRAAIVFADGDSGEEVLAALDAHSNLTEAIVFDSDGEFFAGYGLSGDVQPKLEMLGGEHQLIGARHHWHGDHLDLIRAIDLDGEIVGTIYLRSDLGELKKLKALFVRTGLIVFLLSSLVAFVLSRTLQRSISRPILELASSMKHVTEDQNYSIRAEHEEHGEIGVLINGFNEMLELIQARDHKLNEHRQRLEELVDRRTLELSKTNTDLKDTVSDLREAKDAAESASKAKSQFLANMSHEIRTPMNGVLGMTELLLSTDLNDKQLRFARTVHGSGEALLAVINDILDYSKIEAGKLELETMDFDLRQLTEDVVELFGQAANRKNIAIVGWVAEDVPHGVRGDPNRLRQVLTNLIGNAIKFTETGDVMVRVATDPGDGNLRFSITDSGIGIDEKGVAGIFEAFKQADGSTARRYGGTGLGLAISKQLTELMGGTIGVESELGKGSTFWFTTSLEVTQPDAATSDLSTHLKNMRVLIVDDHEANRNLLQNLVQSWEMEEVLATGAAEALELARDAAEQGRPFDVALLDLHMPGMDGLDLALALKSSRELSSIQLLFLSSAADPGLIRGDADLSEVPYLHKPVRPSLLKRNLIATLAPRESSLKPVPTQVTVESTRLAGARILLAEDNLVNQEVAIQMLKGLGCKVEVVANGKQAVDGFHPDRFDLVLMDCQMPELDGFSATGKIRKREAAVAGGRRVPIVALTANAMEGDREACLEAGMDDYLSKPFRQEDIRVVLERWMPTESNGAKRLAGHLFDANA